MEKTVKVSKYTLSCTEEMARKQRINLLQLACKFKCNITFKNNIGQINGKSLIRINDLQKGDRIQICADGEDQKEALVAFDEFFAEG